MKILGNIKCERCNSNLEWEYIVPQNINSRRIEVERIDTSVYHPSKIQRNDDNSYTLKLECRNCNHVNIFNTKSIK